jgi:hypothetical protein
MFRRAAFVLKSLCAVLLLAAMTNAHANWIYDWTGTCDAGQQCVSVDALFTVADAYAPGTTLNCPHAGPFPDPGCGPPLLVWTIAYHDGTSDVFHAFFDGWQGGVTFATSSTFGIVALHLAAVATTLLSILATLLVLASSHPSMGQLDSSSQAVENSLRVISITRPRIAVLTEHCRRGLRRCTLMNQVSLR